MQKVSFLLPIVLAAALVAGCGGGGGASLNSEDVAVVGGVHISKVEYNALLRQAQQSFKQQGRPFPKQGTTEYAGIKSQGVTLLVNQAERQAKAESMGIEVTDKQVQDRLDQIIKQYFQNKQSRYKAQLKKQHLTEAQVRKDIRAQLISEAVISKVTKDVKVTKDDVHEYYLAHPELYSQPQSRDVRYILVKSKATADSIYNQVKTGGDKAWCRLAKKYAKDQSGQNCGKATFSKGQTVPVFDKIAFSTPTKVVHKPFYAPTQSKAWFVVEPRGAVKPRQSTPEKQVSNTIKQTLLQQKKNQSMTDWVASTSKDFCSGDKIKYQVGYKPTPDPCASTTTNATTTG